MKESNHKYVLLVRSGYPSKEQVLKRLQDLGYYVIILDSKKNCPDGLVDDWIIADLSDNSACIRAIESYLSHKEHRIDGALTFWEEVVTLTAEITERFGWVGIPKKTAEEIKNKYFFRQACERNNLPVPHHAVLSSEADLISIQENLKFPLVIKPVYGAASAFVVKVDSIEELREEYETIKKHIESFWLAPEWINTNVFVEEYIDGQEVDIDILLQDGEIKFFSITDNFQTNEPYFVETGQAAPSSLSKEKQDALIYMASKVLKVLNVGNGCIHFEAKSSSKGPVPIEINLRMGGDEVYSFIKHAWGVDLVDYAVLIALGEKISVHKPETPNLYLEGRYFLPQKEGKIVDIDIDDEAKKSNGVLEVHISKKKDEAVYMPPRDFDYLGWITAKGESAQSAHSNLESNYPKVSFVIS